MLDFKALQQSIRQQAIKKIRTSVISTLMNPHLKGKVTFIPSDSLSHEQKSLELNFAFLYHQNTNTTSNVSKGTITIMFDPMFPQEGPTSVQIETGNGPTYKNREVWPEIQEGDENNVQKVVMSIYREIEKENKCDEGVDKVKLPGSVIKNKNQNFLVSSNSCFSRIKNGGFFQSNDHIQMHQDDMKESNSQFLKGKRNSKPMKKNANLPKFLIRIFIKYLDKFKKIYPRKEYQRLYNDCKKMKEWKRTQNKQHALGLKHLKQLFQDEKNGYPDPNLNRKVVIKIISDYLLQQICQNSQIPETHRLGYLVACRVYALRCRNAALAGRIQSK